MGKTTHVGIPKRYIFSILGFLGFMNLYALRVNLNVAIVAMVKRNESIAGSRQESTSTCQGFVYSNKTEWKPIKEGEFEWNSQTQGIVLGSFYYGYVLTQIPGGVLSQKYNAKWIYGFGILITAVFTLLTPVAARWSVWALVVVRVIEGLGSGVVYPSMNALIGKWSPVMERNRMSACIFAGSSVGAVVSMAFSGILCDLDFLGGWPLAFYVFGFLACVWFVFWMILVEESPYTHRSISKEELVYITDNQEEEKPQKSPIPWKGMFRSFPLWAVVLSFIAGDWISYTFLIELPTYFANVFHIDISQNGAMSALPSLLSGLVGFLSAIVADKLRAHECLSITNVRKILNSIGTLTTSVIILIIAFIGCDPATVTVLASVALGFSGLAFTSMVSLVDLSPAFAGVLFGMSNTLGNMSGFLVPSYVAWIIHDEHTVSNWRKVFLTSSTLYIISGTIYLIFGSSELQPWGKMLPSETELIVRKL